MAPPGRSSGPSAVIPASLWRLQASLSPSQAPHRCPTQGFDLPSTASPIVGTGAIPDLPVVLGFPANSSNAIDTVPTAAISWDVQRVFPVQGKSNLGIMGRSFDLLPGGTMHNASCICRGVVGVTVEIVSDTKAKIINLEPVIMARDDTLPDDLVPWQEELLEAFQSQHV